MTIHNVVINDDTTGTLDVQNPEDFIGEIVTIRAHDENGNPVERRGKLTEILD